MPIYAVDSVLEKEVLFEEEIRQLLFFVLTGSVVVRKKHHLTSVSLAIIGPGGSFGELALSKDSKDGKRTATIVAREMSEFLVISKDVYLEKLSTRNAFEERVTQFKTQMYLERCHGRLRSYRPCAILWRGMFILWILYC